MDEIYIIILFTVPIAMFVSGYFIAWQFQAFENIPFFSMVFAKYRFLHSMVIGFLIALPLTIFLFLEQEFSSFQILAFIALLLLATTGYYLGINLGWKRAQPLTGNVAKEKRVAVSQPPENIFVEDTSTSVKITINTKKRWVWFALSASQWVLMSLCFTPIVFLGSISVLRNYLSQKINIIVGIFVGGFLLYLLYIKFQEILEYAFDKEIIEIDHLSVRIEKNGLGFKSRKEYPVENIKKITLMLSIGGINLAMRRFPMANAKLPAFMLWHNHGVKRYHTFGGAIDYTHAQRILTTVYSKFPQYRG